jgi:hypothetical protein
MPALDTISIIVQLVVGCGLNENVVEFTYSSGFLSGRKYLSKTKN